ncbi:MAG: glycosyltransferase 87 family protein [Flavobacteriales bacterium]
MRNALLLVLLACVGYIAPAYFLQREEFWLQLACFSAEFAIYFWCIKKFSFSFKFSLFICVLPRLVWLASTPVMSDDYHRFYWDGELVEQHMDPYESTPYFLEGQKYTDTDERAKVFKHLNSKSYYSSYPPFNQVLFFIASSTGSEVEFIVVTRCIMILADVLILFLLFKLTRDKKIPFDPVLAYGLNPLVITELTGNLHFEGVSMSIWLLAVWWLLKRKHVFSVLTWAIAACTKLVPVFLLPVIWPAKNFKTAFVYSFVVVLSFGASFLLLTNFEGFQHFSESVKLYFQKFEFNASFYFIARETGTLIKGYNPIHFVGPMMGVLFLLAGLYIVWQAVRKKITDIFLISTLILFAYYLLSTTVHPWYSINLLIPGIIAGLYFPIAWTGLIFLSYIFYGVQYEAAYYSTVAIEYILLFVVFFKEKNRWNSVIRIKN